MILEATRPMLAAFMGARAMRCAHILLNVNGLAVLPCDKCLFPHACSCAALCPGTSGVLLTVMPGRAGDAADAWCVGVHEAKLF